MAINFIFPQWSGLCQFNYFGVCLGVIHLTLTCKIVIGCHCMQQWSNIITNATRQLHRLNVTMHLTQKQLIRISHAEQTVLLCRYCSIKIFIGHFTVIFEFHTVSEKAAFRHLFIVVLGLNNKILTNSLIAVFFVDGTLRLRFCIMRSVILARKQSAYEQCYTK